MKAIIIGLLSAIFLIGCCGPLSTMTDQDLRKKYITFSYGRAIAHDVLWSCGGKSLQYSICRGRIARELMDRGYTWDGHSWVKSPGL